MENLGIYLHWPFCKSKCPYCDFFSLVQRHINQDELIDKYVAQLEEYKHLLGPRHITSVFFGGGTPSLISPRNIEKILTKIKQLWQLDTNAEISLEANPNTNSATLFADLRTAGINRLSLGVQSFDDEELKFLGRTHNSSQAMQAIADMQKHFSNCSIDLIYALPSQNQQKWLDQLQQACNFNLNHISLYQLTIEEGTIFAKKKICPLNEEQAAELYLLSEDFLSQHGLKKYEVSNYARTGFSSRHNMIYWQGDEYIGIGQSAHGRIRLNHQWQAQTDPLQFEPITAQERAEELIIMGLRLTSGINKSKFHSLCGLDFDEFINHDFLTHAVNQGWLLNSRDNICATPSGFLILDSIIKELCC